MGGWRVSGRDVMAEFVVIFDILVFNFTTK